MPRCTRYLSVLGNGTYHSFITFGIQCVIPGVLLSHIWYQMPDDGLFWDDDAYQLPNGPKWCLKRDFSGDGLDNPEKETGDGYLQKQLIHLKVDLTIIFFFHYWYHLLTNDN